MFEEWVSARALGHEIGKAIAEISNKNKEQNFEVTMSLESSKSAERPPLRRQNCFVIESPDSGDASHSGNDSEVPQPRFVVYSSSRQRFNEAIASHRPDASPGCQEECQGNDRMEAELLKTLCLTHCHLISDM